MILNKLYVDEVIKRALLEDINYIDMATDYLIEESETGSAEFVAKAEGIVCGINIAFRVFELLDDTVQTIAYKKDGDFVAKGDIIGIVSGSTRSILRCERTSLNLLQHLSGISTLTKNFVDLVSDTNAIISDTRKTLPGLRALQKYAVTVGGGKNHRYNLSDAAMLKDNHIDASGGIAKAVSKIKSKLGHMTKIELEVRNLDELQQAIEAKVDVIMLDNMNLEDMQKAVNITNNRVILEASGTVSLETVSNIAKTGVNVISVGALTHSVRAFDISLKWKNLK